MYGAHDSFPEALAALNWASWPLVLKADGLCAGKGVLLADDRAAAAEFLEGALRGNALGAGGHKILFEEAIQGDELSFIILMDGETYAPLVPTRDHKRVFDGNQGPNTGGMGAYSSDDLLNESMRSVILRDIVEPTIQGLKADGIRYRGFLYFGLMLAASGPQVLEFNCRLGDPETQAIVARMDFDLAEVLADVAAGRLDASKPRWKPGASVCVVAASGGYPGRFETGKQINGLTDVDGNTGVNVFHAGTKFSGSLVVTSGGRVLGVTAQAASLDTALKNAYAALEKIKFDGMHYRRDIATASRRVGVAGV
jgi:phosphoribosylamine--glycine ligase